MINSSELSLGFQKLMPTGFRKQVGFGARVSKIDSFDENRPVLENRLVLGRF
jgi:hypothetical protein